MSKDVTHRLRELMRSVGFSSFKALSQAATISEKQLLRIRRGEIAQVRVEALLKLSQALQVSVAELLAMVDERQELGGNVVSSTNEAGVNNVRRRQEAGGRRQEAEAPVADFINKAGANGVKRSHQAELKPSVVEPLQELSDLRQEYDRLQKQLAQQRQALWQEFQQESVQTLESLLLQLPTAAYAAQQNPQAPAVKLLPLLRPLDKLLEAWGIESIATVGAEVPYDPQQHQLISGAVQTGDLQAGDRVKVRYTGYRQGDRLLYRAKVSAIEPT